jgi:hypothetical protein
VSRSFGVAVEVEVGFLENEDVGFGVDVRIDEGVLCIFVMAKVLLLYP